MSPELKAFYQTMLAWLANDMPETAYFDRHAGLCHNLVMFLRARNTKWEDLCSITEEQRAQFRQAGLDQVYPFNYDGNDYTDDRHTMYENPKRLAWIKEHAA